MLLVRLVVELINPMISGEPNGCWGLEDFGGWRGGEESHST
jgi:hypothetical protein